MPSLPATASPNPLSYDLSTSTSPRSSTADSLTYASISNPFLQRSQIAQQAPSLSMLNLIADWASAQEPIDSEQVRNHLGAFTPTLWSDLLEERHLENRCAWVGCTNDSCSVYTPSTRTPDDLQDGQGGGEGAARFKLGSSGLFVRSRPLTKEEKEVKRFCGRRCWSRSEWVIERCLGKDKKEEIVFLDEQIARDQRKQGSSKQEQNEPEQQEVQPTHNGAQIDVQGLHIIEKEISPTQEIVAPRPGQEIDFERPLHRHAERPTPTASNSPRSKRPLAPIPSDLAPIIPTTRPVPNPSSTNAIRTSAPPPLPSSGRFEDLSTPLTFLSNPIMVDPQGQEVEWAGVDEEGESELIKQRMEDALQIRSEMRKNGELS
ncbi:BQ2448_5412 [Microbotryum intermedium]|uniref:BQ2448_5412 protein n=1 Tax=Microbotryum intermedium TaxID=269621 RepID=A0A238F6U8_9BASI|nr:BQ2448_5412 [Microbotryum intermedium]